MSCRVPAFDPVPWSQLNPMVQISAPATPLNIIEHALRQSAAEFLSRTLALEVDMTTDLQAGVKDYDIRPPDGYRVHLVRQVCVGHDGCEVEYRGMSRAPCGEMRCREYWFNPPGTLLVGYESCEDMPDGLLVRASIAPTQDSCYIDRDIYERYGEVIAEGALSRILIMPNTAWYNPPSAGIMLRRFGFGVNRAKNDKGREYGGPKMMKAPRFV
jgi:hypothetical protein